MPNMSDMPNMPDEDEDEEFNFNFFISNFCNNDDDIKFGDVYTELTSFIKSIPFRYRD